MLRAFVVAACLAAAAPAWATLYTMTTADDWTILENAQAGDIVEIAPGTYQFRVYLDQVGSAGAPIIIRAQDPNNRPVWDLDGALVNEWPGSYTAGDNHRGCWQVAASGAYYEISGIVFQNCRAESSAGIRMINSGPVTIRDCVLHHNTNGITGASTNLVVEFSELYENGKTITSGNMTHNLYIYGGDLAVRYSYIHDSHEGQLFHVRARHAVLEYNWLARPDAYVGDVMTCEQFCGSAPLTQTMILRGNVIIQGNPNNLSQILVLYQDEAGGIADMDITLINNTIIGTPRSPGDTHRLINFRNDSVGCHAHLSNNIIYEVATLVGVNEPGTPNWSVDGSNNWVTTGTDATGLTSTFEGSDPGFTAVGSLDFTLTAVAEARGKTASISGLPDREYYRDETVTMQYRARASVNDLGAFEHGTSSTPIGPYGTPLPPPDGGLPDDGGAAQTDAGSSDGGLVADSGVPDDAGSPPADGGVSSADGGATGLDGGATTSDGGTVVTDGGLGAGDSGAATSDAGVTNLSSGCGCRVGHGRRATGLLGLLLVLLVRRRSRRRRLTRAHRIT